jgi:hypothetical protein
VAITTVTPSTLAGTPLTGCSASPTLPTGLSISATTCEITGTPSVSVTAATYTVTATNIYGSGQATLSIAVGDVPTVSSYTGSPYSWEQFDTITTLTPTIGGNTFTNCAASPGLPTGLSIDTTTCAISGAPTATQVATDHVITATNAFGTGQATISIAVTTDSIAPAVTSSTPADAATGVAPNSGTITVIFNDQMNTSLTPTLTTGAWNGTSYVFVPNTGTTFVWTNSTTLTINISWVQFPENTKIQWTLALANLRDNSMNVIAADVVRTFTTNSRNTYFAIADTGQTLCYNASVALGTCGDLSFPYQDGDFVNTPNARNFTKAAHVTYTSDYTTTDSVTGLVWKTCSEGTQSGATCATGSASMYNWYNAVNQCAALNTANTGAGYAGRTNWRLPTSAELESLPDYGTSASAKIDAAGFPATVALSYSSASAYAPTPTSAWSVSFFNGVVGGDVLKTTSYYVRCVSN